MTDYDSSLLHYDEVLKTSNIKDLVSSSQIEQIDTLILSLVSQKRKKVAYIITQALSILKENKQLKIFESFKDNSDLLLAQRVYELMEQKKFEAHGDVRAMRFSEINLI